MQTGNNYTMLKEKTFTFDNGRKFVEISIKGIVIKENESKFIAVARGNFVNEMKIYKPNTLVLPIEPELVENICQELLVCSGSKKQLQSSVSTLKSPLTKDIYTRSSFKGII